MRGTGNENSGYADFEVNGHQLALFGKEPMAQAIGAEPPKPKPKEHDDVCLVFAVEDVDPHIAASRRKEFYRLTSHMIEKIGASVAFTFVILLET